MAGEVEVIAVRAPVYISGCLPCRGGGSSSDESSSSSSSNSSGDSSSDSSSGIVIVVAELVEMKWKWW